MSKNVGQTRQRDGKQDLSKVLEREHTFGQSFSHSKSISLFIPKSLRGAYVSSYIKPASVMSYSIKVCTRERGEQGRNMPDISLIHWILAIVCSTDVWDSRKMAVHRGVLRNAVLTPECGI